MATPRIGLSVAEAAGALGLSESSCMKAIDRGQIPAVRIGRRIVVSTEGLKRLLDGQEGTNVNAIDGSSS